MSKEAFLLQYKYKFEINKNVEAIDDTAIDWMAIVGGISSIDSDVGKNKPVETPQQVTYKEEDHWGYPYVVKYNKWASEKGIKGISELRLDDNITRAEAIRLLVDTIAALEK